MFLCVMHLACKRSLIMSISMCVLTPSMSLAQAVFLVSVARMPCPCC